MGRQAAAVVRLVQSRGDWRKEGRERSKEVLLLKSDSHALTNGITEEPLGGLSKNMIGKSLRRRILPGFALSTLIINLVVNLVVMATGD